MKLHILHVSAIVYISAQLACSPRYAPRTTDHLVLTRDAYLKDGVSHSRDLFRTNLKRLVQDDARALSYAQAAHQNRVAGLASDVASIVTGLLGAGLAVTQDDHFNDVAAQVLLSTSLVAAIVGPFFHSRVADNEVDAVSAYNEHASLLPSSEVPMTPSRRLGPVLPDAIGAPDSSNNRAQQHTEEPQ
jgi:hypothetical protein